MASPAAKMASPDKAKTATPEKAKEEIKPEKQHEQPGLEFKMDMVRPPPRAIAPAHARASRHAHPHGTPELLLYPYCMPAAARRSPSTSVTATRAARSSR